MTSFPYEIAKLNPVCKHCFHGTDAELSGGNELGLRQPERPWRPCVGWIIPIEPVRDDA